ncbi:MAG: insulinase family protein [Clostridia bacterium]|nr:insulinase family protein [Clostridia bacterium]
MIKKMILGNSSTLIYEQLTHVRSVCIGVWFKVGSIYEDEKNRGIAHFIEHMIFKGTKTRSAKQIATELDNIGGHLNAFTSKELTCFYAKTLEENIEVAIDVLADMIINSAFDKEMIKKEKQVVLEEIAMYNDSPEDFSYEKMEEQMWKGHPLSYPISGYKETVKKLTQKQIFDFMEKFYKPDNMVISVAGNFDEKHLIALLSEKFDSFKGHSEKIEIGLPTFYLCNEINKKDIEQTYLSMAFEAYGYDDDRRFSLLAASNLLGGGMSSKLFQHVREEKGLVYTIGSSVEAFHGTGFIHIYAGMNKSNLKKVQECIKYELNEMKSNSITEAELRKAKQQLKSGLIMGLESTTSRMNSNARSMILRDKIFDQDELMKNIDDITINDISKITEEIFNWEKKAVSIVTSK